MRRQQGSAVPGRLGLSDSSLAGLAAVGSAGVQGNLVACVCGS